MADFFPTNPIVGDTITLGNKVYEYDGSKWNSKAVSTNAGSVSYDNSTSGLVATYVQGAIDELSTEVTNIESTDIIDSTAAGRSMLTAANAQAQRTLLSLTGIPYAATSTDFDTVFSSFGIHAYGGVNQDYSTVHFPNAIPENTAQSVWWNTLTFGVVGRTSQLAAQGYNADAYCRNRVLWYRNKHDETWSSWYLIPTFSNIMDMDVTASGNFAIGTKTDNGSGAKLQVAGSISTSNSYMFEPRASSTRSVITGYGDGYNIAGPTSGVFTMAVHSESNASDGVGIGWDSTNKLGFIYAANYGTGSSWSTQALNISAINGNILINTTTDNGTGAKLQVNGTTTSTSFTNAHSLGANSANARNHFTQYNAGNAGIYTGWISAAFGDSLGQRIVIGQFDGVTVISGHGSDLAGWAPVRIKTEGNGLIPHTDNNEPLGGPSNRWSVVYAATGTINTSDAREKTEVRPLTDAELQASKQLAREIGAFKFLSSVAEKGDLAREHIGLTVQRAIEIMEGHGLDPFNYGFICHDKWDGRDIDGRVVKEAGDRYSFRSDELTLFIIRGMEERLAALENT